MSLKPGDLFECLCQSCERHYPPYVYRFIEIKESRLETYMLGDLIFPRINKGLKFYNHEWGELQKFTFPQQLVL